MKTKIRSIYKNITFLLALPLLYMVGCSPSTQLTGSWKSPQATQQTYNRIIVAALTDNVTARQLVENDLQAQLAQRGIQATKSIDIFPPAMMRERGSDADMILQRIQGDGHDAILTAAVIDEKTNTRFVPGNQGMYAPMTGFGWYGNFRGYYGHYQPMFFDPGYYREDQVYFIETNLYDAQTENLLWSAQYEKVNPSSLQRASKRFSEVAVNTMREQNLIN